MTGKKRHIEAKLSKLLTLFPVVAILGARQTGKTTLAKQAVSTWRYFDIENPMDYEFISRDPVFFFSQYPDSIILDEAQHYPALFSVLRGVIDNDRHRKGRFLLTGSASPDLMRQLSESLAGRIAYIELDTLKATEIYEKELSPFYTLFQNPITPSFKLENPSPLTRKQLQSAWLYGGYPEPVLADNLLFWSQWMENYRSSYVYRDLGQWFPKLNKIAFQRFLTILGKLSGTVINKRQLARDVEVSETTIKDYLGILQGTYLWRSLQSFEKNIRKSVIKMPKGHIRDLGLLHYMLKLNSIDQVLADPIVGRSFESFIIEELFKGLQCTTITNWEGYYYRTRNGAEIDLILDGPFGTLPIEIKSGILTSANQLRALQSFIQENQLPLGLIINQSEQPTWLSPNILQIPAGWI